MKQALAFALVAVFGFSILSLESSNTENNSFANKLALKSFNGFKNRGRD